MQQTITIMGGTFNPIHKGHIAIAKAAHDQFNLNDILVMPSGHPAYKDDSAIISAKDRCNMVELAIQDYPYMHLSTMEVEREGNTYTADTLRILKNTYDEIYFIIGADSLFAITKWHQPEFICNNCHLLAANRDKTSDTNLLQQKKFLENKYNAVIDFIQCEDYPFSSTDIRNRVKLGQDITFAVHKDVADYILNNNLYL